MIVRRVIRQVIVKKRRILKMCFKFYTVKREGRGWYDFNEFIKVKLNKNAYLFYLLKN